MPDFRSDTNNPNNPSHGHPEQHPHYGRPWMDPACGGDWDDDEDSSHGITPASDSPNEMHDDVEGPIPVWLFDHS
jgi:hypothetical protein